MYVIKRDQTTESVNFEKIAERLRKLVAEANLTEIDVGRVTQEIVRNMSDKMHTSEIDTLAANVCVAKQLENPEYERLATRLTVSNIHKTTEACVVATYSKLEPILDREFFEFVMTHGDVLNGIIDQDRDYDFDFFGVSTMTKLYCAKKDDVLVERPGHVYLRVACVVSRYDLSKIRTTYEILSKKQAVFGSPTLFNAGMKTHQLASCFLMTMEDSIDGIFESFSDMAKVSKLGGGIGVYVGDVRSRGAPITSTNGKTDGLLPMVRCVNSIAQYVNQSSKRKGAIAVYIGVDHPDILDLLDIRRPGGDETKRARDVFLALMVSDLFMTRVKEGAVWSLFDPFECPGLSDTYGDEYNGLYALYESQGKAKLTIPARELWDRVCRAQIESGVPYILYKDSINQKSNQKNLGTIKCSNLCAEIVQFSNEDEIAVCNLGSVCLSRFVIPGESGGTFDYHAFMDVVRTMAENLDSVIDANFYPTEKTRRSNMRHRPIGLGIQGLYDCLVKMAIPYDSDKAVAVSTKIANAMYFAAMDASCDLAKVYGPYETYEGSPMSQGDMQFDLWNVEPDDTFAWRLLREKIKRHGLRNSLSVAIMPTASSSQICGNVEAAEPITSLVYVRRTLAGEHVCLYRPLVDQLVEHGVWTEDLMNEIIRANGSIQHIETIPVRVRRLFPTAWDIKQKWIIDHAAARAPFICQTQSMNIFMSRPTLKSVAKMHAYGHAKGLKTGMYYMRTKAASSAAQISISTVSKSLSTVVPQATQTTVQNEVGDLSDDEESVCLNCSG